MTKNDFFYLLDTHKEYEFTYEGTRYNLTYGKDKKNKPYIAFGRLYDVPETFSSISDLWINAKIGAQYFRNVVENSL